jgi:hypothetical protein
MVLTVVVVNGCVAGDVLLMLAVGPYYDYDYDYDL